MDVRNARYNPEGLVDATHVRLPVADASIDVVYLYSVFSHMGVPDVRAYLREFRRIIKPGGGLFLTAFLERDVPDATVNPPDYRAAWHGALHCVRFERGFFERLLQEHGFSVSGVTYATETDGQSAVTARAVEHSPVVRAQSTSHTPSR
jgi:ubiquinone/menaquinone biosynthesis C-methylase UbiE